MRKRNVSWNSAAMRQSMNDYQTGWHLYADHQSIDSCTTEAMRRGWWAANRAEAWAEVS